MTGLQTCALPIWEVTHAAGHVKSLARWIEDNPVVGIWDPHYLLLDRRVLRSVVDEHVLFRVRPFKRRAVGIVYAVVPASENQQGLGIGTHHGGNRLPGQPGWIVGPIWWILFPTPINDPYAAPRQPVISSTAILGTGGNTKECSYDHYAE